MNRNDPNFNVERRRYYGLRKGDLVTIEHFHELYEVVNYGLLNNNYVYVKPVEKSYEMGMVAELCKIHTKVENR